MPAPNERAWAVERDRLLAIGADFRDFHWQPLSAARASHGVTVTRPTVFPLMSRAVASVPPFRYVIILSFGRMSRSARRTSLKMRRSAFDGRMFAWAAL